MECIRNLVASVFGGGKKKAQKTSKISPAEAQARKAASEKATAKAARQAERAEALMRKKTKKRKKSPPVNVGDVKASIALFDRMDGTRWQDRSGWRSVLPVTQWFGVRVDECRVTEISLGGNGLKVTGGLILRFPQCPTPTYRLTFPSAVHLPE